MVSWFNPLATVSINISSFTMMVVDDRDHHESQSNYGGDSSSPTMHHEFLLPLTIINHYDHQSPLQPH